MSVFTKNYKEVLILGNGPTLKDNLQEILDYQSRGVVVFGVNRIFLSEEIRTDYYVALDRHLWRHNFEDILSQNCQHYFAGKMYYPKMQQVENLSVIEYSNNPLDFATKWGQKIGHGHTSVYAAMQLAVIAGAEKIDIFGVDGGPDKSGKTHFFGSRNRKEKAWNAINRGITAGLEKLSQLGIPYQIHSEVYHAR